MVTAPQTFTYTQASGLDLQLDYYAPPSGSKQPAPFLFSIHGGGGSGGDRKDLRLWSLALAQSRGWALISADYRLIPECDATCAAQDTLAAWRFITHELNGKLGSEAVDGSKGIVFGISAGGWSATLLGAMAEPRPAAFVNMYGTWDLKAGEWGKPAPVQMPLPGLEQAKPFLDGLILQAKSGAGTPQSGNYLNIFRLLQLPDAAIEQICQANGLSTQQLQAIGLDAPMSQQQVLRNMLSPYSCNEGLLDGMAEGPDGSAPDWEKYPASPARLFDAKYPPTITLHGNKDVLVPFRLAEQLTAALKQAGVRAELIVLEGADHMFDIAWHPHVEQVQQVAAFLDSVLAV